MLFFVHEFYRPYTGLNKRIPLHFIILGKFACSVILLFWTISIILKLIIITEVLSCKTNSVVRCPSEIMSYSLYRHLQSQIILLLDKVKKMSLKYLYSEHLEPRFTRHTYQHYLQYNAVCIIKLFSWIVYFIAYKM